MTFLSTEDVSHSLTEYLANLLFKFSAASFKTYRVDVMAEVVVDEDVE